MWHFHSDLYSEAAFVSLAPSLAVQGIALLRGPFLGWGFPIGRVSQRRSSKREFYIGSLAGSGESRNPERWNLPYQERT